MTIKDVLSQAAFLLGKDELVSYLKGENGYESQASEAAALLKCYNIVENEIALDYIPLTAEQTVSVLAGKIYYTVLTHTPVSVLSVTDTYGNKLPFTIYPEYVQTKSGARVIDYTYAPTAKTLTGNCEYGNRVSLRVFAYGVACEYCLINGRYEEALVWDRKYKDALLCVAALNRPHIVRARRWV